MVDSLVTTGSLLSSVVNVTTNVQQCNKCSPYQSIGIRQQSKAYWKDTETLDDIYATRYLRHIPPFPDMEGIGAVKHFIVDCRNAYPDLQITIDEIVVEDNTVITRWIYQGTQTGPSPMLGVAPTGKKILFSGCNVSHLVDGKIVEEWQYADFLGLLQQLGVVTPMQLDKE